MASLGLHAPARAQLPVAPGQDKGGILWSWQSRGRCHQRPGSGTAPSPADLPSPLPCPQQPRQPPQCHIPSTRAGGCASFAPAPCHGDAAASKAGWGRSSSAVPKGAPGPASWQAEERADAQGGPPAPSTPPRVPVPVCSPGGHLGVGDLGGFLGQAAALGGDQVVVLGHVLVRVVQAAGAGPGWGPRGQAGGWSACAPFPRGWATWGQPQQTAQGPPLSCANPLPRTLIPLSGTPSLSGGHWADQGHPLRIHALPTP